MNEDATSRCARRPQFGLGFLLLVVVALAFVLSYPGIVVFVLMCLSPIGPVVIFWVACRRLSGPITRGEWISLFAGVFLSVVLALFIAMTLAVWYTHR
jgi:hypothetical protein